ncbi:MAG: hypothetical protein AAGC77_10460 [Pseudomonadota bacterium]
MIIGTRWFGIVLAILGFAGIMAFEYSDIVRANMALQGVTPEKRAPRELAEMADWVFVWLSFWRYLMFVALLFGIWYREAQWYTLAWLVNHAMIFAGGALLPGALFSLKFFSFTLWLFIPVLILFVRKWSTADWPPAYRLWVAVAGAQIVLAMAFDIPAGIGFFMEVSQAIFGGAGAAT